MADDKVEQIVTLIEMEIRHAVLMQSNPTRYSGWDESFRAGWECREIALKDLRSQIREKLGV